MVMKAMLAHIDEHDGLDSVLTLSMLAARLFGSHIDGVCTSAAVAQVMPVAPEGMVIATIPMVEGAEAADRERRRQLREHFEAFMADIRQHDPENAGLAASAAWYAGDLPTTGALGSLGRIYDLIIVARPVERQHIMLMSALEAALFESGRPLLIAPPQPPKSLARRIVIGWNGSTETARTIALGMPILAKAEEVLILSVENGGMVPGPSGREVAAHLRHNEIEAKTKTVNGAGRNAGMVMLEECSQFGADLLFKGAYTNSRFRQMIFGGATSHILAAAELPVLMAH